LEGVGRFQELKWNFSATNFMTRTGYESRACYTIRIRGTSLEHRTVQDGNTPQSHTSAYTSLYGTSGKIWKNISESDQYMFLLKTIHRVIA
jgi:hypothetical protein